jgi:hypothetical protein
MFRKRAVKCAAEVLQDEPGVHCLVRGSRQSYRTQELDAGSDDTSKEDE